MLWLVLAWIVVGVFFFFTFRNPKHRKSTEIIEEYRRRLKAQS